MKQCMNPIGKPITVMGVEMQRLCTLPLDKEGLCGQCVECAYLRCRSHGEGFPCGKCQSPSRPTVEKSLLV